MKKRKESECVTRRDSRTFDQYKFTHSNQENETSSDIDEWWEEYEKEQMLYAEKMDEELIKAKEEISDMLQRPDDESYEDREFAKRREVFERDVYEDILEEIKELEEYDWTSGCGIPVFESHIIVNNFDDIAYYNLPIGSKATPYLEGRGYWWIPIGHLDFYNTIDFVLLGEDCKYVPNKEAIKELADKYVDYNI